MSVNSWLTDQDQLLLHTLHSIGKGRGGRVQCLKALIAIFIHHFESSRFLK